MVISLTNMGENYNVKVVSRYVNLNPRTRRNFIRIQIFLKSIVSSDYDTMIIPFASSASFSTKFINSVV